MSGDVQLELYLHKYKMEALSSVLEEQDSSVEEQMQEMLIDLYAELVPYEVQQQIRTRIDTEHAKEWAAMEAVKKYTVFRLRENGTDAFFQLDRQEDFLCVAQFLRRYLQDAQEPARAALKNSFAGLEAVTVGQYDQMTALRMENPNKVTGVFDLDFDKREISIVDAADGWKSYSMKDVSAAIYHACRKSNLKLEQYASRFSEKLADRQLPSAGHLSVREISLADEICEMEGQRLNFYLETGFDVDAVFGTHICTAENDDTLNVYADYDMAAGQVCDMLEVDLHRADGKEESLEYRLNAVEKVVLLRKMDDYCQQQTGQSLADYSAQLMTEDAQEADSLREQVEQNHGPEMAM